MRSVDDFHDLTVRYNRADLAAIDLLDSVKVPIELKPSASLHSSSQSQRNTLVAEVR
jgi:hypothetical protein